MAAKRSVLAVAAAATVVSIGFLAFMGTRADGPVVTQAGESPTIPVTGNDPTLVSAGRPTPDAPRPRELAAIVGGSVVVLDGSDGHTLRTLATHAEATTGGFPYLEGVTLAPDRSQVFYALAGDCGPATIYRVAADGRTPAEAIVSGVSPALSPDGRKLAYAVPGGWGVSPRQGRREPPETAPSPVASPTPSAPVSSPPAEPDGVSYSDELSERRCQNSVVVRDLQTGVERTWRYPDTPDYAINLYQQAVITEIAWAPDSTRLAYTLSYEGDSVSILDTQADADLSRTVEVVIPGGGGNSSHPAWQATSGLLGVFNTRFECCFDDNYTGPARTLLVNPERRLAVPLLPSGRRVTALDFDTSGAHLLFVDGGRLYRRSGEKAPVAMTPGVTAADW